MSLVPAGMVSRAATTDVSGPPRQLGNGGVGFTDAACPHECGERGANANQDGEGEQASAARETPDACHVRFLSRLLSPDDPELAVSVPRTGWREGPRYPSRIDVAGGP